MVLVELITIARAKAMAAPRQPLTQEALPGVSESAVAAPVGATCPPSCGQLQLLQAWGQHRRWRDRDTGGRAQLIGWNRLGVVVVDRNHPDIGRVQEPRRADDAGQSLKCLMDRVVRTDVRHCSDADVRAALDLDIPGQGSLVNEEVGRVRGKRGVRAVGVDAAGGLQLTGKGRVTLALFPLNFLDKARCSLGVLPKASRNARVKDSWVSKPASSAIWRTESSCFASRQAARSSRSRRCSCNGVSPSKPRKTRWK